MPVIFRSGFLLLVLVNTIATCWAQEVSVLQDRLFCNTSLGYQPRPTFFSVKHFRSSGYLIRQSNGSDMEIANNSSFEVNLRAPVVMRPGLKVAASFTYYNEEFDFRSPESARFTGALHDKSLRSFNTSLFVITPFRGKLFLAHRLQASLSGDRFDSQKNTYLNYSLASVMGWRKSEKTILGLGLIYKVDFDGDAVFPLLAYQHQFSPQWSVDAILPARTRARYYSPNHKNVVTADATLNSPKYNINMTYPSDVGNQYIFQRNEVRWSLGYQREIHDWLWMEITGGFTSPISSKWLEADHTANTAFEMSFQNNLFTSIGLFLVVPQKLFDRKK